MHQVGLAVLGVLARDDPDLAPQRQVLPSHPAHLVPALTCEGQHLNDRAERKPNLPSRSQYKG
jgi:hypothetical protein